MKALKGKFQSVDQHHYGLFLIIFNEEGGFIETSDIIVTNESAIFNEPIESWSHQQALEKIQAVKMKGSFIQSMTKDLFNSLNSAAQDESFYVELFRYVAEGAKDKIKFMIKNLLYRSMSAKDSELIIETHTEDFNHELLSESGDIGGAGAGGGSSAELVAPVDQYVNIKLMLSPIRGKYIVDLKEGDRLLVRIDSANPRGSFWIDKLGLRDGSEILPTPADVVKVVQTENGREVHVKIADNTFGKVTEEERVKVALYDPSQQQIKRSLKIESETGAIGGKTTGDLLSTGDKKAKGEGPPFLLIAMGGLVLACIIMIYVLLSID